MPFSDALASGDTQFPISGGMSNSSLIDLLRSAAPIMRQMKSPYGTQMGDQLNNLPIRQTGLNNLAPSSVLPPVYNGPTGHSGEPVNVVYGGDSPVNMPTSNFRENPNKDQLDLAYTKLSNQNDQASQKLASQDEKHKSDLVMKQKEYDIQQQKSNQIHETKMADMQRKVDEANKVLEEKKREFEAKQGDTGALLEFHKAQLEATKAQHAAELAQKDKQITDLNNYRDFQNKLGQQKLDAAGNPITKTETINPDKNTKTTTITKGASKTSSDENAPESPTPGWHYEKNADGTAWTAVKD